MAEQQRDNGQSKRDQDYVKGGKGRRDEVGGSGIYPASSANAPADAEIRTESELVGHKGPHPKSTDEQGVKKSDESSGSE
jgi:hypothetical protein